MRSFKHLCAVLPMGFLLMGIGSICLAPTAARAPVPPDESLIGHFELEQVGDPSTSRIALQIGPGRTGRSGQAEATFTLRRVITDPCPPGSLPALDLPTMASVTFDGNFTGNLATDSPGWPPDLPRAAAGATYSGPGSMSFPGELLWSGERTFSRPRTTTANLTMNAPVTVRIGLRTFALVPDDGAATAGSASAASLLVSAIVNPAQDFSIPCVRQ